MLKGLPASGKSTYAKELADKGWVRVSKDDLRAMLNNSKWSKRNERRVIQLRDKIVFDALASNENVVVDDTNFAPIHEQELSRIARELGADFEVRFFDTPLEVCIKRDAKRANGVGKDVIMQMYNQYLKPAPVAYMYETGSPKAVMVDVDGTLAHMKDRSPFDWHKVGDDAVDYCVSEVVRVLSKADYKIIIMSGRDSVCRQETKNWLRENDIPYDYIYMRKEGDNRKDSIVKLELFDEHIRGKFNISFVLDDRNQVVDMWRSIGLKTFQVAEGDF